MNLPASLTFLPTAIQARVIAQSNVAKHWDPGAFVYEPGFTYRVVPALLQRVAPRPNLRVEA
jgi:hypothetical protein